MSIKKIPTAGMSREQWLEVRRKSIGGSDAAAILGLNPYSSPYSVWAEKTGRIPEAPDNEAMRQGRDLEDYVARRFCEASGKKVRRVNAILRNSAYPFAHANIDRDVTGEYAGLECKTTSVLNLRRFQHGEYPDTYYCQCMHYMAVTGAKKWYLAVLVLNKDFLVYEIPRDEAEITALMQAESAFWEQVRRDAPPPMDGLPATTEALKTIYAESIPGGTVDLFGQRSVLEQYSQIREQIKELDTEKERLEQILKQQLGEAEKGRCEGWSVMWKELVRSSFDAKEFIKDHPDEDLSGYYKHTKARRFSVKEEIA